MLSALVFLAAGVVPRYGFPSGNYGDASALPGHRVLDFSAVSTRSSTFCMQEHASRVKSCGSSAFSNCTGSCSGHDLSSISCSAVQMPPVCRAGRTMPSSLPGVGALSAQTHGSFGATLDNNMTLAERLVGSPEYDLSSILRFEVQVPPPAYADWPSPSSSCQSWPHRTIRCHVTTCCLTASLVASRRIF